MWSEIQNPQSFKRIHKHIQFVSKCRNEDECKFGPGKCWFLHQEEIEIAYQNAKDDMDDENKIYDMEWYWIKIQTNSNNEINMTHDLQKWKLDKRS